eukprot:tig00021580_g22596.t1
MWQSQQQLATVPGPAGMQLVPAGVSGAELLGHPAQHGYRKPKKPKKSGGFVPGRHVLLIHAIEASGARGQALPCLKERKQGRMLANRDVGGFSDPYVEAVLSFTNSSEKRRTKAKARTANCIFDEYLQFEFECFDEMHMDAGKLDLYVKDSDMLIDDAIGSVHLDLREIYSKRYHQLWQEWTALSDYPPDFKLEGFLKVSITILGPGEVYVIPSAASKQRRRHAARLSSLFASSAEAGDAVSLHSFGPRTPDHRPTPDPAHAPPPPLSPLPPVALPPGGAGVAPPPSSRRLQQYPPGSSVPMQPAGAAMPTPAPAPGPPGTRSRSIQFPGPAAGPSAGKSQAPMAPPEEEPAEDFYWPRPRPPPLAHVDAFVIHIETIKAEHLPRMDMFSRRGAAAVDAFVEVSIGGYKAVTTDVITSYDPKWYARASLPMILPRKVDDEGRPMPLPRGGDVDFDSVYFPFPDRVRVSVCDSDVIGSDLVATLPYMKDLSIRALLLRLWAAERRLGDVRGLSAEAAQRLLVWRPEEDKAARAEQEAEEAALRAGKKSVLGASAADMLWARRQVEPMPRWINLYGAPPDSSGKYCEAMNQGVQRGSAYRGRLLMRAWIQRTNTLDVVPRFVPMSLPLEFGDAEVRLSFDLFEAAYLRVPDSSALGASHACRVELSMGPYVLRSVLSSPVRHGTAAWDAHVTATLRFPEIVPPALPQRDGAPLTDKEAATRAAKEMEAWAANLPDIFVSVHKGTSKKRLGYLRVKALDLIKSPPVPGATDAVRGGTEWAPPTELNWHPLQSDGLAQAAEASESDGDFAGFLFCRAALQVVSMTAPGESRPFGATATAAAPSSTLYAPPGPGEDAWKPPAPTAQHPFAWAGSEDAAVAAEEERLAAVARRIVREQAEARTERVEALLYMARKLLPGDQPGTSDAYVRMRLWSPEDRFSATTSVIYKTQNPVWNERFVADVKVREFGWMVVEDPTGPALPAVTPTSGRATLWPLLYVEVFDRDETSRDDLLGIYHLPIDSFPEHVDDLLRGEDYRQNAPKGAKGRLPFLPLSFKLCKHVPGKALAPSKGQLVAAFLRHVPSGRSERPCVALPEKPRRARLRIDLLGIRLTPSSPFVRGDRLLLEFDMGDNRSFAVEWPEPGSAEAAAAAAAMKLVSDPFAAVRQAAQSAKEVATDVAGAVAAAGGSGDKKEVAGVDAQGVKGGNVLDKVMKGTGDAFLRFLDSATIRRTVYIPYEFYERALAGYRPVLTVRVYKYVSRLPLKVMAGVATIKITDRVLQCSRSGEYWKPLLTTELDGRPAPGSAAWPPSELRKPPRGFNVRRPAPTGSSLSAAHAGRGRCVDAAGGAAAAGRGGVPLGVSASFSQQRGREAPMPPSGDEYSYAIGPGATPLGRRRTGELSLALAPGGGGAPLSTRQLQMLNAGLNPATLGDHDSDGGSIGSWMSNADEEFEGDHPGLAPGGNPDFPGYAFVPRELRWTGHHADERFRRELKDLQMWNECPIIRGAKVASTASFSDKINEFFGNRVQLDSTESIGKLKVWATLEEEENQAPDGPPWQAADRLSTEVLPALVTPGSRYAAFPKQRVVVRCYVLRGYNLPQMDNGEQGKADPYLRFLLGGLEDIRKKERKAATMQPKFYETFTKHVELPGSSLLTLQLFDYDVLGRDELIGETTIDLEDRWYSRQWQASVAAWDPLKRRTYSLPARPDPESLAPGVFLTRPMERRTLRDPCQPKLSRGQVEIIVDMMTMEEAASHPAITLVPPNQRFEVRAIVWQARNLSIKDRVSNSNDVFVACVLEAGDHFEDVTQETDVHLNAKEGKGLLHWRFIFPVDLPLAHPVLKFQAFDKDVLGSDAIGEVALDVTDLCDAAYANNSGVTRRRLRCAKLARQWLRIYHPDVPEELKRREAAGGGCCGCLGAPAAALSRTVLDAVGAKRDFYEDYCTGELEVEVEVLPAELAAKRPAGKGRSEPNRNPYIPEPARSKFSWFNPLDILKEWIGPELVGKVAGVGACVLVCLCIAFLIPLIISQTLSFKIAAATDK